MSEYIPYSKRHNIDQGTELAWLLDYLEREIGREIKCISDFEKIKIYGYEDWRIRIDYDSDDRWEVTLNNKKEQYLTLFRADLFFRTYKTLLPAIRDLYHNKT